jgi:hypothetical protein
MQRESALSMAGGVCEGCRSDVTNLRNKVVELLLGVAVLLGHVLVLLLPLVGGLLECLHLALVVAGLDVGLAEPARQSVLSVVLLIHKDLPQNILLVGLPQVLVVLLGLLLEQLEPPLQRLILRAVLCALVHRSLGILVKTLELVDLLLEDAVLVLQGSDLLLLLKVLLLESPDL